VLIYSQDGLGLGHLRRNTNIAREILKLEPDASILIVADSPAAPFFSAPKGVDFLKLPTIVKTGDSSWSAQQLGLPIEEVLRLRSRLILKAYRKFRPDIVLVDHMPVGALGELKPVLDAALADERRPRLFLGLRDVLDRPAVVRSVWEATGAYNYLSAYEAVLIYGTPELFDSATIYHLTDRSKQIICCNYVALEPPSSPAVEQRSPSEPPLVLVMGGGGADFFPIARTYVESLQHLPADIEVHSAILPGPNMPRDQVETLSLMAGELPVEVLRGFEDAAYWLQRASAIVMMAGYNSICEVMAWQKRALVIPRRGPSAEQRVRTRLFGARNLLHMLDPDDLSPQSLARCLAAMLVDESIPHVESIPPLDGAQRAAAVLLAV
jgi:predicted glycosyltransferase